MDTTERGSADTVREHKMPESVLECAKERFWKKVDKNGPISEHRPELGPCWIWTKTIIKSGYGQFWRGKPSKKLIRAHRWSYEFTVRQIPDGFELDHLCRVKSCVNPMHLEVVTHKENVLRGNSFSAQNARKTYCKQGHPFTENSTYKLLHGGRDCKLCHALRRRNRKTKLSTRVK